MTTTYKEIAKSGAKFGKSEGCVRITAFALLRVPNDFHGVRWCILCEYFVHDGICLYFSVVNRSFFCLYIRMTGCGMRTEHEERHKTDKLYAFAYSACRNSAKI